MNEIFEYIKQNSTIGNLYYFADKVNGHFVIKEGKEDVKLFPREETYGFFYIKNIEYDRNGFIDTYNMTFYYFYNSVESDKITKSEEVLEYLKKLRSQTFGVIFRSCNINNDEILNDFIHEKNAGSSERKLIKIDFELKYENGCNPVL